MSNLALVSCAKKKRDDPAPAQDLYISDWFTKCRKYVEGRCDRWLILSAKHGLVHPDEVLAPYEESLYDLPAARRREWARGVSQDLREHLVPEDTVEVYAGNIYRQYLMDALRREGKDVVVPMKGLGIGQQLSWLKQRNSA